MSTFKLTLFHTLISRGIHASHWVQQDEPAEVNRLMRTFLQS